jgi:hypothetical protein
MIKFRKVNSEDINTISEISFNSFDNSNIIIKKLGISYTRNVFFKSILETNLAKGIIAYEDEKILGYGLYIIDYDKWSIYFQKNYFFKNAFYIFKSILEFKISLYDIYNIFKTKKWVEKYRNLMKVNYGPVCVNKDIKGTAFGGMIAIDLMRELLQIMSDDGVKECWCTQNIQNNVLKFNKYFGFKVIDTLKLKNISELFLVKKFNETK